jgi:hypothetical protein
MKPTNPNLHRWATRLFFLLLMPSLLSCEDKRAHERLTAIESKLDKLIESNQADTRMQPLFGEEKRTKKIKVDKNSGRTRVEICVKAIADWSKVDSVVVSVKRKRFVRRLDDWSVTLTSLEPAQTFGYRDKDESALHLTAKFYIGRKATEGSWCDQNGTDCQIPADQKCSDISVPIATVKSTAASGNSSVTVSVDEQ